MDIAGIVKTKFNFNDGSKLEIWLARIGASNTLFSDQAGNVFLRETSRRRNRVPSILHNTRSGCMLYNDEAGNLFLETVSGEPDAESLMLYDKKRMGYRSQVWNGDESTFYSANANLIEAAAKRASKAQKHYSPLDDIA